MEFGACEREHNQNVRLPELDEAKDEDWEPLTDFPKRPNWYIIARSKLYRADDSIKIDKLREILF